MTCKCSETQEKSKAELARERVIDLALQEANKGAPHTKQHFVPGSNVVWSTKEEGEREGVNLELLRVYTELIKVLDQW